MPIATGLGFVEREAAVHHVRTVVRPAPAVDAAGGNAYVVSPAERATCGVLIAGVVAGSLATLGWFSLTFDGT